MMVKRPEIGGPRFDRMMAEVDAQLTADGVDIPGRPLMAAREVSMRYGLSIPLAGDPAGMPPELRANAALSDAIRAWYTENYGDRLKENPCPGHAVVLLDGDLYVLRVPRILGSAKFVLTREWLPEPAISRGPAICNIVQLVSDMTPAKAARLSDPAMTELGAVFEIAIPAIYTLESTDHRLMEIALGDVGVAVAGLMARNGRFGESKWASLQAAEKVLKAAIDLSGRKYKYTHVLADLCVTLAAAGLSFDAGSEIAAIQCEPAIRYGDEPCSREEALAAHQASLALVNILRDAGAGFELGIGGIKAGGGSG